MAGKYKARSPFLQRIYMPDDAEIENSYPFSIPIVQKAPLDIEFTTPVTIIAGENGTGKSTILECIAYHCGFNVSGGNKNHLYTQNADIAPLATALRFSWRPKVTNGFFMRAESFINFAGYVDQLAEETGRDALAPYGGVSLNEQSHGEAFLSLFENRFGRQGIYILDEPEAALSPSRQLQLIAVLHELEQSNNTQIIMATHSPMLMCFPNARLLYIDDGDIQETDYKHTSHYQITRRFLENPQRYLQEIFD